MSNVPLQNIPIKPIASDTERTAFDVEARQVLQALASLIIPASAQFQVPGADDAEIFADVLRTLVPQSAQVQEAIRLLNEMSGCPFDQLAEEGRAQVAGQFRRHRTPGLTAILNAVLQCYYRDDRVMRSLGMAVRPPFPEGYELEQGDWSLLDPVRARPKIYREV